MEVLRRPVLRQPSADDAGSEGRQKSSSHFCRWENARLIRMNRENSVSSVMCCTQKAVSSGYASISMLIRLQAVFPYNVWTEIKS